MNSAQDVKIKKDNPYKALLLQYPNSIYRFEQFDADVVRVRQACAQYKKIFVEIGSGSGMHLISRAKSDPISLFCGFEVRYKRAYLTAQKAAKASVENLVVLRTDAQSLSNIFLNDSVSGIYVNFPDPWDKRRDRKHRLLTNGFIQTAWNVLSSNGFLSIKTDHQEYFTSFLKSQDVNELFRQKESTTDLYQSELLKDNVSTEFENLFRHKGIKVCYAFLDKNFRNC